MNKRLAIHIALLVIGVALTGAVLVSMVIYVYTEKSQWAAAQRTLGQLGVTVLENARIAAYLDNAELAREVTRSLTYNDLVAAAVLHSVTGLEVRYGEPRPQDRDRAVRIPLLAPFLPETWVGTLTLYPHSTRIERQAQTLTGQWALLLGGYSLALAVLVVLAIQWQLVSAIQKIARELHAIDPSQPGRMRLSAAERHDEIGQLARDINQLLTQIEVHLRQERALRSDFERLERRFRRIFERASIGIVLLDARATVLMANPASTALLGPLPRGAALGPQFEEAAAVTRMVVATANDARTREADLRLAHPPDEPRWVHALFTRIHIDPDDADLDQAALVQVVLTDITARKQYEHQMQMAAERDPLTGALNRRGAQTALDLLWEQARHRGGEIVVILLDLDGFKQVNDQQGHWAGDQVLQGVTERLRAILRAEDVLARLGGDEFLVALTDSDARGAGETVAHKILERLAAPFVLSNGVQTQIGASLGLDWAAPVTEEQETSAYLLLHADQAMYAAKNAGKNTFRCYDRLHHGMHGSTADQAGTAGNPAKASATSLGS